MSTTIDLDTAMRVYLGADESGGYCPGLASECLQRLQAADIPDSEEVQAAIEERLSLMMSWPVDWKLETLAEASRRVEARLAECMPDIGPRARRAMSNYFSYHWK